MNIFVLDDDMTRIKTYQQMFIGHTMEYAMNSDDAIKMINEKKYDIIFLDHDLGGRQMVSSTLYDSGFRVAVAILDSLNKETNVIVHSYNSVGAQNMCNVLKDRKKGSVQYRPFLSFDEEILKEEEFKIEGCQSG